MTCSQILDFLGSHPDLSVYAVIADSPELGATKINREDFCYNLLRHCKQSKQLDQNELAVKTGIHVRLSPMGSMIIVEKEPPQTSSPDSQ
jgi:hypothetical protein